MSAGDAGRSFAEFFLSLGASYLPTFYRERWMPGPQLDLRRGALLTGTFQFVACLVLFIFGYFRWIAEIGAVFARAYAEGKAGDLTEAQYRAGVGIVSLISYLLRPATILLAYFAVEGLARLSAAIVTGEAVGTLPLWLAALLQQRIEKKKLEKFMGVLVSDLVQPGDGVQYDLRIASCRPKDWGSLVTLQYEGELYVVSGTGSAAAPRRFVYELKRLPKGTVARGLRVYDPEECVSEAVSNQPSAVSRAR